MENQDMMSPFFELPNKNPLTCHVFCFPDAPSDPHYSLAHFGQIMREVCWTLKATGNKVHYYGYESCDVECDEKIITGDEELLKKARPQVHEMFGHTDFSSDDAETLEYLHERWALDTEHEVKKRYSPGDFFMWILPSSRQRSLFGRVQDLPVRHIEASIGYIGGFLPYRVFQSQSIKTFHYGMYQTNSWWYDSLDEQTKAARPPGSHSMHTYIGWESPPKHDEVIPIPFDISRFDFRLKKKDYLLCLARVVKGKGIKEAVEVAERLGMKLIIAGPGDFQEVVGKRPSGNIELLGAVGGEERKDLLSNAFAVLCLSELYETFGMTLREAWLSGTVPIVSNRGAFIEAVETEHNGFVVPYDDTEGAIRAIKNVGNIDPYVLRDAGLRYSREYVAPQYNEFLQSIDGAINGLTRVYPESVNPKEKIAWPDGWMTPTDNAKKDEVKKDA